MDLVRILRELHKELDHLDAAIVSLERLQESGKKLAAALKPEKARAGAKKSRQERARVQAG